MQQTVKTRAKYGIVVYYKLLGGRHTPALKLTTRLFQYS